MVTWPHVLGNIVVTEACGRDDSLPQTGRAETREQGPRD